MIQKVTAYQSADGAVWHSLEAVQCHEISELLKECLPGVVSMDKVGEVVAKKIVAEKAQLIDILTTGPNSKPKARAVNGGTKKRKPRVMAGTLVSTGEELTLPGDAGR